MPKSILTSRYKLVDDNDKYVREECQQSNEPIFTSQSVGTDSTSPTPSTPSPSTSTPSPSGSRLCPESGRICNYAICANECLGDKDGFADNIGYTGIPIPTPKRENSSGWSCPCVVVGAVCETWTTAAERVPRRPDSSGFAK